MKKKDEAELVAGLATALFERIKSYAEEAFHDEILFERVIIASLSIVLSESIATTAELNLVVPKGTKAEDRTWLDEIKRQADVINEAKRKGTA